MNLLYIGNKHYKNIKVKSVLETLESLFENFITVKTCSDKKNKVFRLFDMLFYFFRYGLFYKKIMIDVYSTLAIQYAYTFSILSIIFNKKYILFLHGGNLPNKFESSPTLLKLILSKAEKIISPSAYLASFFKEKGFNVIIIPNIIEIEKYPFFLRKNIRPKILSIRGFSKIYNPIMTLKAMQLLKSDYPNFELLMLGLSTDDQYKSVNDFINQNDLAKNVIIKEKMSLSKWIKISKNYDVMVSNPVIDNTPVSLIEGMALGMCIISTNVGGVPFLVKKENCILVENNNHIELAKKIKFLIKNPSFASKLSHAGRRESKLYSWRKVKALWEKELTT